jgi:CHAT domain-containing protein
MRRTATRLVDRLIQTPDWWVARQLLHDHPGQLLNDTALRFVGQQVERFRSDGSSQELAILACYARWLRRCREYGLPSRVPDLVDPIDLLRRAQRATALAAEHAASETETNLLELLGAWREVFDSSAFRSAHPLTRRSLEAEFTRGIEGAASDSDLTELARLRAGCLDFSDTCYPLSPSRRIVLGAVIQCDRELFNRTGQRGAMDAALQMAVLVLFESSRVATDLAEQQYGLAHLLLQRYESFGSEADLNQAIDALEQTAAIDEADSGSGERERYLSSLGAALRERYIRAGDPQDFNRAAAALGEVARATQTAGSLIEVGLVHWFRYERTGDEEAAQDAEQFFTWAAQSSDPGSEDHLEALNDLGMILTSRHQHTARAGALDGAIAIQRAALASGPANSEHFLRNKVNLARALLERYRRDGGADDVNRAVDLAQEAIRAWPDGPSEHEAVLAGSLFHRYLVGGEPTDLDHAVTILDRMLQRPSTDVRDPARLASNAGFVNLQRFQDRGAIEDLDMAVAHHRTAAQASPPGSPEHAERVLGLASALRVRADHLGDPAALAEALDLLDKAARQLPQDAPMLPRILDSLAALQLSRYELAVDRDAARLAVSLLERAARLTNHEEPVILTNLARSLATVPGPEAQDRAVAVASRAVELTGPDSPQLPLRLKNLAHALAFRFVVNGGTEDEVAAVDAYRNACAIGLDGDTQTAFDAGIEWGHWAADRADWVAAAEAFAMATRAADDLFARQATRSHREFSTDRTTPAFGLLSYALTRTGDYDEAAVALERGRARLLAETFRRSPLGLDRLRKLGHTDLVDRFVRASQHVTSLQRSEFASVGLGTDSLSDSSRAQTEALREARTEFEAARAAIRATPGLDTFLAPPSLQDVVHASETAAIVYLSASNRGGHAMAVRHGRVQDIALPELDLRQLAQRWQAFSEAYALRSADRQAWRRQLDETTQWLWDAAMGPVLDQLDGEDRAAIVPCGLLGSLPVHAAWTPDSTATTGRRYAMDRVLLTYAPNALSMNDAARARSNDGEALVVVDDPRRPDLVRLEYAESEVELVTRTWPTSRVLPRDVRKEQVLAELPFADVLHVVCHGRADIVAPLESCLELAGERLRLADVMTVGDLETRLVVLSACETASAGVALPDESISFPTGLLQAGARGVIATMWAIPDRSAMILMARFYQLWRHAGHSPAQALRGAQLWVRDSTNAEKQAALGTSVLPGPSSGPAAKLWKSAREMADPVHWAGFTYHGR